MRFPTVVFYNASSVVEGSSIIAHRIKICCRTKHQTPNTMPLDNKGKKILVGAGIVVAIIIIIVVAIILSKPTAVASPGPSPGAPPGAPPDAAPTAFDLLIQSPSLFISSFTFLDSGDADGELDFILGSYTKTAIAAAPTVTGETVIAAWAKTYELGFVTYSRNDTTMMQSLKIMHDNGAAELNLIANHDVNTFDWTGINHSKWTVYDDVSDDKLRSVSLEPVTLIGNLANARGNVDRFSGQIYLLNADLSGIKGKCVKFWSHYNNQNTKSVTPIIMQKVNDNSYAVRGIGTTVINSNYPSVQTQSFGLVSGSDTIGENYYVGHYDGSWDGVTSTATPNSGAVEYNDSPDVSVIDKINSTGTIWLDGTNVNVDGFNTVLNSDVSVALRHYSIDFSAADAAG